MEDNDQHQIQNHIQDRRKHQHDQRHFAVAHGAQKCGEQIVGHAGRNAHADHADIGIGVRKDFLRRVHQTQKGPHHCKTSRCHDDNHRHGQNHAVGNALLYSLRIPCAVALSRQHGKAAGKAGAKAQNQEHDGAGRADGGQRIRTHKASHNDGVAHVVKLLKHIPDEQRNGEADDDG